MRQADEVAQKFDHRVVTRVATHITLSVMCVAGVQHNRGAAVHYVELCFLTR